MAALRNVSSRNRWAVPVTWGRACACPVGCLEALREGLVSVNHQARAEASEEGFNVCCDTIWMIYATEPGKVFGLDRSGKYQNRVSANMPCQPNFGRCIADNTDPFS